MLVQSLEDKINAGGSRDRRDSELLTVSKLMKI